MADSGIFSKILADRIKKTTALSNEIRLRIVLSIFNTEVLNIYHSLTLSQLEKMLKVDKHDLAYHLNVLMDVKLIDKKDYEEDGKKKTYYCTTKEGVRILELLGISKDKVKELSQKPEIFA